VVPPLRRCQVQPVCGLPSWTLAAECSACASNPVDCPRPIVQCDLVYYLKFCDEFCVMFWTEEEVGIVVTEISNNITGHRKCVERGCFVNQTTPPLHTLE